MNKEVTHGCGSLDALQARRHTPEVGDGNGFSSKGSLDGDGERAPGSTQESEESQPLFFGARISLL